jgi:hypothetical protein
VNPIVVGKLGAFPKFSSLCRFWCINVLNWIFATKLGALPNLILIALNSLQLLWIWSFDFWVVDFNVLLCYVFILLGFDFVTCIIYGSKFLVNFSNNNVDNFYSFGYTSNFPWKILAHLPWFAFPSFKSHHCSSSCLHILVMLYAINFLQVDNKLLCLLSFISTCLVLGAKYNLKTSTQASCIC